MAGETTTSTIAGVIDSSYISKIALDYAIDANVMLPRVRYEAVANGSGTAAFAVPTKSSGVAAITEASGMGNSALTFTNTTLTASEVGILRQLTKKAGRFSVIGDLEAWAVGDGQKLVLEKMETDALGVVTSASTSVGTSGANATIANMAGAISQSVINKSRGKKFFVWTAFQGRDIRAQVAASAAPILQYVGGDQLLAGPDDNGFTGVFMGAEVYESNLCPSAASDKVGVLAVDGYLKPENAPIGCALGWMPEMERAPTPALPGVQVAMTACYAFGEISDFNYVKIVTIGS